MLIKLIENFEFFGYFNIVCLDRIHEWLVKNIMKSVYEHNSLAREKKLCPSIKLHILRTNLSVQFCIIKPMQIVMLSILNIYF